MSVAITVAPTGPATAVEEAHHQGTAVAQLHRRLQLWQEGRPAEPLQFGIVLGVRGGMAATADNVLTMVRQLPPDADSRVASFEEAEALLSPPGDRQ